jgi:hypothetical protein
MSDINQAPQEAVTIPQVAPTSTNGTGKSVRDRIRDSVLVNRKPKRKPIDFFGEAIEIQQPLLADIIQAANAPDRQAAILETLINNAFVPGTEDKVFTEDDIETLAALPFGKDFSDVMGAFEALTSVNFLSSKQASNGTVSN